MYRINITKSNVIELCISIKSSESAFTAICHFLSIQSFYLKEIILKMNCIIFPFIQKKRFISLSKIFIDTFK